VEQQKEDARKQAEEIVAKARHSIALEREQVLNEAKEEISSLVVLTTSKVLQKELNEDEKSRFANAAAEELKISD
jgi:F-type H+-transporting ATPase subunit b